MKKMKLFSLAFLTSALGLASCSDDNNPDPTPNPVSEGKYVLLTAEGIKDGAGYYAVYDELPSGNVDNTGGYSLQADSYGGFRVYKNWIFNRYNLTGETGVVCFAIGENGRLYEKGFIKCDASAQNIVVNDKLGFYYDPGRGKTKIQKFNPSTMQRTGDIDLSSVVKTGISDNVRTGNQTLAYKEGKLYVNVTYSPKDGSGHNDNIQHYTMAVIDVETEKIDKTIVVDFAEIYNQGHSPSEYPAWLLGDDGNLYFITSGWDTNANGDTEFRPSCVFRIKKGETDFDKNWLLKSSDLNSKLTMGFMWSMGFYKNKLFIEASNKNATNWDDWSLVDGYEVYALDIESKKATKLSLPLTIFGHSAGTLYRAGDRLFVRVVNEETNYNGLYIVNEDALSASPAFNLVKGGEPMGFTRLQE